MCIPFILMSRVPPVSRLFLFLGYLVFIIIFMAQVVAFISVVSATAQLKLMASWHYIGGYVEAVLTAWAVYRSYWNICLFLFGPVIIHYISWPEIVFQLWFFLRSSPRRLCWHFHRSASDGINIVWPVCMASFTEQATPMTYGAGNVIKTVESMLGSFTTASSNRTSQQVLLPFC